MASDTKNERGLIFLHIPKTAGTTLPTVIDRHYLPHATYYFYEYPKDRNDFFALSEERRRELRVLSGHIRFGFHRFLFVPVDYITLLRDPVDLVMSLYYWIPRTRDAWLYPWVEGKSLSDFAASDSTWINNIQTRLISGQINDPSGEDLKVAIDNLSVHFTAFGLHARFDESLMLFKRRLGWKSTFYARQNVTKDRPSRLKEAELSSTKNERDVFSEQVSRKEANLTRITNSLGWRLLSRYGRIKYRCLLPVYRVLGLSRYITDSRLRVQQSGDD